MSAHDNGSPAAFLVRGRRFILRGNQWVDEAVEAMPSARRIRVRFDSPEFFRLLLRTPELLPNIGSTRNVQLALGDMIYEIYD